MGQPRHACDVLGAWPVSETTESTLKARIYGVKASLLDLATNTALYIGFTHHKVTSMFIHIRNQKLVTSDDFTIDKDLDNRPTAMLKIKGLLTNTNGITSTASKMPVSDFNANVISLFNAAEEPIKWDNGILKYSPISGMLIRLHRMYNPDKDEN